MITEPLSGVTWSAWAYRTGGEYAIAVSFREHGGWWSEPLLIGADDRLDQVEPALVADPSGSLYLAYAVRPSGVVYVTAMRAGTPRWFEPQAVTQTSERAWSPALRVVGDRLVLAYRTGRSGVGILDWGLLTPPTSTTQGIQEGPDGFPLPSKQQRASEEPADTSPKRFGPGGSGDTTDGSPATP